jgi:GTP-binding protein EngB required for normal cell division
MNEYLRATGFPFTIVATKADKISRGARMKNIAAICRALQVQPWEVIPYSSEDGTGRDALLSLLEKILNDKGYNIARRTVAKYREQLNIPVARLRKEMK